MTWQTTLELPEINALVDWHIEQKRQAADKEDYQAAESHRRRALELATLVQTTQPEGGCG